MMSCIASNPGANSTGAPDPGAFSGGDDDDVFVTGVVPASRVRRLFAEVRVVAYRTNPMTLLNTEIPASKRRCIEGAAAAQMGAFENFPNDLYKEIFSFFITRDFLSVRKTCRFWRELAIKQQRILDTTGWPELPPARVLARILPAIVDCSHLHTFRLHETSEELFTVGALEILKAKCPNLRVFEAPYAAVFRRRSAMQQLGQLTSLRHLDLSYTAASMIGETGFLLSALTRLETFEMRRVPSRANYDFIANFVNLKKLDLYGSDLNDSTQIFAVIGNMKTLTSLTFGTVTANPDAVLVRIGDLTNLTFLMMKFEKQPTNYAALRNLLQLRTLVVTPHADNSAVFDFLSHVEVSFIVY